MKAYISSKLNRLNLESNNKTASRQLKTQTKSAVIFTNIVLVLLVFATWQLQQSQGAQSVVRADSYSNRVVSIPASRGIIYDIQQKRLVENRLTFGLSVNAGQYSAAELEQIAETILSIDPNIQLTNMEILKSGDNVSGPVVIANNISPEEIVLIKAGLGGWDIGINEESSRYYPYSDVLGVITGYVGPVSGEDINRGYSYNDTVGKTGLEFAAEDWLAGIKGQYVGGVNTGSLTSPVPGDNLILNLNLNWQLLAYGLLDRQVNQVGAVAGAFTIMDTQTGQVVVYASFPTYDPNKLISGISVDEILGYQNSPGRPLLDKVSGIQSPPGSTYKILSALAGLQGGAITADSSIVSTGCMNLGGYNFCEFGRFQLGELNLVSALARSSNIFFCYHSLRLVGKNSYSAYREVLSGLGMGRKTGLDLPGELAGVFPTPELKQSLYSEGWFGGDTCNTSIGQGMVLVTPIQMMVATAAIANGGQVLRPQIINRVENSNGEVLKEFTPDVVNQIEIDPEHRQLIIQGMHDAVNTPTGTGYRVLYGTPGNVKVKTGSAEAIDVVDGNIVQKAHGWVVGLFDYEGKEYAFTLHLRFGGGGWNASPVLRKFLECIYSSDSSICY